MDSLIFLGFIIVAVIVAVPIMLIISFGKISTLQRQVNGLEGKVKRQAKSINDLKDTLNRDIYYEQEYTATDQAWHGREQTQDYPDEALAPVQQVDVSRAASIAEQQTPTEAYTTSYPQEIAPEHSGTELTQAPYLSETTYTSKLNQELYEVEQEPQQVRAGEVYEERSQPQRVLRREAATKHARRPRPGEAKRARKPARSTTPDFADAALAAIKNWFTTGNIPVKIGVLVLFAGVAALLKYVTDQGWLNFPMQARLACISVVSIGVFAFAWHKRIEHRVFSLSLQGGAIGVLLLTLFAAFKLYGFISAPVAFGATVMLVLLLGVLAVKQNAMTIAILAILAGFLSPLWLSTGSGNHVALFSYYAILNAGIFAMSWWRPWRHLNLLGFIFTFGIGTMWGIDAYTPTKFASIEPFLLLFFSFYLLIPLFYARKFVGDNKKIVDAALVFGTPLVAFSLQAALLQNELYTLAVCAAGISVIYGGLALLVKGKERLVEFIPAYIALAAGFITLAVPLAFSAQQTSCIYALEGVAVIWWGIKTRRALPQITGIALQILSAIAFMVRGVVTRPDVLILNPAAINMIILAAVGFFVAWCYRDGVKVGDSYIDKLFQESKLANGVPFYLWGLGWWCVVGIHEIGYFAQLIHFPDLGLIFAVVTATLAAEVYRCHKARVLSLTIFIGLALAPLFSLWQNSLHMSPLRYMGWAAWFVFIVLGIRAIRAWRNEVPSKTVALLTQFIWWPTLVIVATLSLHEWLSKAMLIDEWVYPIAALPLLALTALTLFGWRIVQEPLGKGFIVLKGELQLVCFSIGALLWLGAVWQPTQSTPLPWFPILNPVELLQLIFVGLLWVWVKKDIGKKYIPKKMHAGLFAGIGFTMLSVMVLRVIYHVGGATPWSMILSSTLAQTSLSIVWSITGVAAWIYGSRHGRRMIWWGGAILMGVVLAKLLLIDRQNLGNVLGIISFIGYGLLCVIVGYFAPAPPKEVFEAMQEKGKVEASR